MIIFIPTAKRLPRKDDLCLVGWEILTAPGDTEDERTIYEPRIITPNMLGELKELIKEPKEPMP